MNHKKCFDTVLTAQKSVSALLNSSEIGKDPSKRRSKCAKTKTLPYLERKLLVRITITNHDHDHPLMIDINSSLTVVTPNTHPSAVVHCGDVNVNWTVSPVPMVGVSCQKLARPQTALSLSNRCQHCRQ